MNYYEYYSDFLKEGRSKWDRPIANNTRVRQLVRRKVVIKFHYTDIATFRPDGSYRLNSGGWRTTTTQNRINRFTPAKVYSDGSGNWDVYTDTDRARFVDGMVIPANGSLQDHKAEVFSKHIESVRFSIHVQKQLLREAANAVSAMAFECTYCGEYNAGPDRFCTNCEEYNDQD